MWDYGSAICRAGTPHQQCLQASLKPISLLKKMFVKKKSFFSSCLALKSSKSKKINSSNVTNGNKNLVETQKLVSIGFSGKFQSTNNYTVTGQYTCLPTFNSLQNAVAQTTQASFPITVMHCMRTMIQCRRNCVKISALVSEVGNLTRFLRTTQKQHLLYPLRQLCPSPIQVKLYVCADTKLWL